MVININVLVCHNKYINRELDHVNKSSISSRGLNRFLLQGKGSHHDCFGFFAADMTVMHYALGWREGGQKRGREEGGKEREGRREGGGREREREPFSTAHRQTVAVQSLPTLVSHKVSCEPPLYTS